MKSQPPRPRPHHRAARREACGKLHPLLALSSASDATVQNRKRDRDTERDDRKRERERERDRGMHDILGVVIAT